MKARNKQADASINEVRLLDTSQLCIYVNLGRNSAVTLAKNINADRKIGRRILFDKKIIDQWLDEQVGGGD